MKSAQLFSEPMVSKVKMVPPFAVRQAMVALELGPADDVVLSYLNFLAGRIAIKQYYFLHVLPAFDLFEALYEREADSLESNHELNEEVVRRMEKRIYEAMPQLQPHTVELEVLEGNPLERLLEEAAEMRADLLVIGQRGGSGQHGILARNLVRKAKGNALIVPQLAQNHLRTVLVPIDFSPSSVQALQTALALRQACAEPLRVICLNVYEMPDLHAYRIYKTREEFRAMIAEDRRQAFRDFLNQHAPGEEALDIETVLIEQEKPGVASYILDFAAREMADLIIMGAKGHSKVELLLMGSVTEKVLSTNEHIPTLIVKSPE